MSRVLAGVVGAALSAALVSAQSADATWPPPGVVTLITPGMTRPEPISRVPLKYTPEALKQRLQGVVTIACVIEALSGSNWWVWQELYVPTSHFDRAAIQVPEFAAFTGARRWHFTTIVGNEMVIVFVNRLIRSGRTPEMIESDLRASGQIFDQILRRMTFESR